jgi:hypothetical protein
MTSTSNKNPELNSTKILDLIPGKIEPIVGSIKTVYIDNFLSEKHIYDGRRWNPACRWDMCTEEPTHNELCEEHNLCQIRINVEGEIIVKGPRRYRWTSNKWIMICNIGFCEAPACNSGYCKKHNKKSLMAGPTMYSSQQSFANIYNMAKNQVVIGRQKQQKILKELSKKTGKSVVKNTDTNTEKQSENGEE